MSTNITELNLTRKNMVEALGDNDGEYFGYMKQWFRQKITKEEFDLCARRLLKQELVHFHNEFLLAILNKCQSLSSTYQPKDTDERRHSVIISKENRKKAKKKNRTIKLNFDHRFVPADPLKHAQPFMPKDPADIRPSSCHQELCIPDISMVHGRMLLQSWENGLQDVEDSGVKLVMTAAEHSLKSILTAILKRRHGYKLREGKFIHSIGTMLPSPYLRNTLSVQATDNYDVTSTDDDAHQVALVRPTPEHCEAAAVMQVACSSAPSAALLPAVNLWDVLEALRVHRDCITSHTVYSLNVERLLAKLWHPSHEDLMNEQIQKQEAVLKQQQREQQTILTTAVDMPFI